MSWGVNQIRGALQWTAMMCLASACLEVKVLSAVQKPNDTPIPQPDGTPSSILKQGTRYITVTNKRCLGDSDQISDPQIESFLLKESQQIEIQRSILVQGSGSQCVAKVSGYLEAPSQLRLTSLQTTACRAPSKEMVTQSTVFKAVKAQVQNEVEITIGRCCRVYAEELL
jgi:hypothetical protein